MENFITELMELIMNGVSPAQYIASFFFATLGGLSSLIFNAINRKNTVENPQKFSKTFLIVDNIQRIIGSIIATFILIRLSNMVFDPLTTIRISFIFGYSSDNAMKFVRNLTKKTAETESIENHLLRK